MELAFYKYHGAGNDFILIDERRKQLLSEHPRSEIIIRDLCDRRTGIGADGLMLLRTGDTCDFKMIYYNSDGKESTMCGNGGRCISAFAHMLEAAGNTMHFTAADGVHQSTILTAKGNHYMVSLQMKDLLQEDISIVKLPGMSQDIYSLNTGSPHLVIFVENVSEIDVYNDGRAIRHSGDYNEKGINVNFVQQTGTSGLYVRTYERGVEAETLSCGTGATAAAIAAYMAHIRHPGNTYHIKTKGGNLQLSFNPPEADFNGFRNIWLTGPAVQVFEGKTIMEW
jgi:diaminopimelate epimerase